MNWALKLQFFLSYTVNENLACAGKSSGMPYSRKIFRQNACRKVFRHVPERKLNVPANLDNFHHFLAHAGKFPGTCRSFFRQKRYRESFRHVPEQKFDFRHMPGNFPAHAGFFSGTALAGRLSGTCQNTMVSSFTVCDDHPQKQALRLGDF